MRFVFMPWYVTIKITLIHFLCSCLPFDKHFGYNSLPIKPSPKCSCNVGNSRNCLMAKQLVAFIWPGYGLWAC